MPFKIIVCGQAELHCLCGRFKPTHAVSLLEPGQQAPRYPNLNAERHLTLAFDDIHEPVPGFVCPNEEHIRSLLRFGEKVRPWIADGKVRLLVDCAAGISRAPAVAFALLCQLTDMTEAEALAALAQMRPEMSPNRLVTQCADRALDRQGRMVAALDAWLARQAGAAKTRGSGTDPNPKGFRPEPA